MALFDRKGTLTGGATAVPAGGAMAATGSVSVAIGDLIVFNSSELSASVVITGATDNLGGVAYTAISAGTVSTVASRVFWKRADVAGTLTTITGAGVASNNDFAVAAAVYTGPFRGPTQTSLDVHPVAATDGATPFTCTATGTLTQATELVICTLSISRAQTDIAATSPLLLDIAAHSAADNTANSVSAAIGSKVVAATTTTTPAFSITSGTVNGGVEFTTSFMPGVEIVPASGNLNFSPVAINEIFAYTIQPTRVDTAFSFSIPDRVVNVNISPIRNDLILTTSIPNIVIPNNIEIIPSNVNIIFSQSSIDLFRQDTISPNRNDLIFTTSIPDLFRQDIILPNKIDLGFSTSALDRVVDSLIELNKIDLSFSLNSLDVQLSDNKDLNIDNDNLLFSSSIPNLIVNSLLELGKSDLLFSTSIIDVIWTDNKEIVFTQNNLLISVFIPDIVSTDNRNIESDINDLSFNLSNPSLVIDYLRSSSFADLSFSNFTPNLDIKFEPNVNDLNLTSSSPDLIWTDGNYLNPSFIDLKFNSLAPDLIITNNQEINLSFVDLNFSTFSPEIDSGTSGAIQASTVNLDFELFNPNLLWQDGHYIDVGESNLSFISSILNVSISNNNLIILNQVNLSFNSSPPNLINNYLISSNQNDLIFSLNSLDVVQTFNVNIDIIEKDLNLSSNSLEISQSFNTYLFPSLCDLNFSTNTPDLYIAGANPTNIEIPSYFAWIGGFLPHVKSKQDRLRVRLGEVEKRKSANISNFRNRNNLSSKRARRFESAQSRSFVGLSNSRKG